MGQDRAKKRNAVTAGLTVSTKGPIAGFDNVLIRHKSAAIIPLHPAF